MTDVIYKIQAPDGSILKIQGPEGATEADLQGAAEAHFAAQQAPKTEDIPRHKEERGHKFAQVTPAAKLGMTALAGMQGVVEPFAGMAQWLGINKPAQAIQKNQEYAESIAGTPAQVANIGGNLVSPLPIKGAGAVEKALGYAPKLASSAVVKGGLQGLMQGAMMPTTVNEGEGYGDFLSEKAKQLGVSGGLGAVAGKATQLAMAPQVSEKLQMLKDMGMKAFTPGQLAGQFPFIGQSLQKAEQAATSIPLAGQVIGSGIHKTFEDFNRALGNRVLEPLGIKVPKEIPAGNEMLSYVKDKIGGAYDALLQNATFRDYVNPRTGQNTVERLDKLMNRVSNNLVPKEREMFQRDIVDNMITHIDQLKVMSGSQFRNLEKYLGNQANNFYEKGASSLGEAYSSMQNMLRNELRKQNPKVGKELEAAHKAFRELEPVEKASKMVGAQEGVFTPAQLKSSAKGNVDYQPVSNAGVNVLGNTLPSSGTAERMLTAGALGLGAASQASDNSMVQSLGLPLALAGMVYNKPAMNVLTKIATDRPQAVRNMAPTVANAAARAGALTQAQQPQQPLTPPQ